MDYKGMFAVAVGYGAGIWCAWLALGKTLVFQRAKHWPGVRGKITESIVVRDEKGKAIAFSIRYEFTVGDRMEGSTPRLSGGGFWTDKQQAEFVARYAPGQDVEVFYDPRNPRRNCLDRQDKSGISTLWVVAALGTILASALVWLKHSR